MYTLFAQIVFNSMKEMDLISCNSMISFKEKNKQDGSISQKKKKKMGV